MLIYRHVTLLMPLKMSDSCSTNCLNIIYQVLRTRYTNGDRCKNIGLTSDRQCPRRNAADVPNGSKSQRPRH